MKRSQLPTAVRLRFDELEQAVVHLTEKSARTNDVIRTSRERLSGSFKSTSEADDCQALLAQAVADLPVLQKRLGRAKVALVRCKQFVDELDDDATLEPVKVQTDGHDRAAIDNQLHAAMDELEMLGRVPLPSANIEKRVKAYVSALARPRVMGIANGELDVKWPETTAALLAFLHPDAMVKALRDEIERQANTPMPIDERKQRIAELQFQINQLQRQQLTLDPDTAGLPADVLLGVRIAQQNKVRVPRVRAA
jgi:hypothetical protein